MTKSKGYLNRKYLDYYFHLAYIVDILLDESKFSTSPEDSDRALKTIWHVLTKLFFFWKAGYKIQYVWRSAIDLAVYASEQMHTE